MHQNSSLKRPGWSCRDTFWSRFCRDFLLVLDFVVWMCLQVLQVPPKSQVPVFDFVAWVCLQVSQVSPRCPKWPVIDFVACFQERSDFPIQYQKPIHVGQQGFQGTILFRIKDLRRSPAFFLQNQSHSQSIKSLGPHGLQNQDRTGVQPKMGDFWVFASLWSLIL